MFNLNVVSSNAEFIAYLHKESTVFDERIFSFSSMEAAKRIISRYALYAVREEIISQLIKNNKISPRQIDDFVLCIPSGELSDLLDSIQAKLEAHLVSDGVFHFEGFLSFRLKSETASLSRTVRKSLEEFNEYYSEASNVSSLHKILSGQTAQESEMFLVVNENQDIVLRSRSKIYLADKVENEDLALSHLILLAPKRINVYESVPSLSKEIVILLKELFKEKVEFFNGKYIVD